MWRHAPTRQPLRVRNASSPCWRHHTLDAPARRRATITGDLSLAVYLLHVPVEMLTHRVKTPDCGDPVLPSFGEVLLGAHIFGAAAFYGVHKPIVTRLLRRVQGEQGARGATPSVPGTKSSAEYVTDASAEPASERKMDAV